MRKKLTNIHLWVGLVLILPLISVSITGIMLNLKPLVLSMGYTKDQIRPVFKLIKHIHTGEIIGVTGEIVSVLMALGLITLVITGAYLALKRIRKPS